METEIFLENYLLFSKISLLSNYAEMKMKV